MRPPGPPESGAAEEFARRPFHLPEWFTRRRQVLGPAAMISVAVIVIATGSFLWWTDNLNLGSAGLAGVWVVSLIGAATIMIPVPGLAAVCVAASPGVGLNPFVVGVVAGSAEAVGEMIGYMAGSGGRGLLRRHRLYPRLRLLMSRWGGLVLFVGAAVPNPVFDIIGLLAGSVGYPVRKFLPIVFAGKAVKSTFIAYGCFYGIGLAEWIVNGV